jgi:dihydropteroate synthase
MNPDTLLHAIHSAADGARGPLVMGIVNVTPDSFSDGGLALSPEDSAARAAQILAEGADIIDLGAESTRPGSGGVSGDEERARLLPALAAVMAACPGAMLSIDTRRPEIMRAAADLYPGQGFIWNDVSGLRFSPESLAQAADLSGPVVIMHAQGDPHSMQDRPRYGDVVADVACWLESRAEIAIKAGIAARRIVLDPGIGFGKRGDHIVALLRDLPSLTALGFPVLVGVSRKRFIGEFDAGVEAHRRLGGSLAAALWAGLRGAAILRVHDVRETVQALAIWRAIARAQRPAPDREDDLPGI